MNTEITVDLTGIKVMIGMPTHRDIPLRTMHALLATHDCCYRMGLPVSMGIVSSGVVTNARNDVLDVFLKSDCNRLFWIDSDMVWKPEQFIRMVAFSTLYPVVTAAYPAKMDTVTFFVKHAQPLTKNIHGLVPIQGCGLGFTILQREPLEVMAKSASMVYDEINRTETADVFRLDQVYEAGRLKRRTEDIAFFADLEAAGYPVLLDPDINLGHIGTKEYTGAILDALK